MAENILDTIIAKKIKEVQTARVTVPETELETSEFYAADAVVEGFPGR